MSFASGGFLSGGEKKTNTDSHATDARMFTESGVLSGNQSLSNIGGGKNANVNLSLVSSDYGAIGAALGMSEKNLSTVSSLASDGISAASKSLNNSAEIAYRGLDNSSNLVYDGLNKTLGVVQDVINLGGAQNLEFLGKVENFSELAANHWLESAKLSDSQARYAMDYTAKENNANRAMLSDANREIGNAYTNANQGLLALADYSIDKFAVMQNESTKAISNYAQSAQNASLKALDMVFESTKSPDERIIGDSTKWLVGGVVAAIALVFVMPRMMKAA